MLKNVFIACCLCSIVSGRVLLAQSDLGLMRMMHEAFENNPELRAIRDRNKERYPVCPPMLESAEKTAGKDAHAWRVVGRCALKQNRPSIAETSFRNAAELEPTAEAYSLLGLTLVREKKLADVVPVLRKAAVLDRREDQLYRAWGAYYLQQDDLKRAAFYYNKALEILYPEGPGLGEADEDYATLARIYARMSDHQSAIAAYQEACFAYLCFDDQTTIGFGVELIAAGRKEELQMLIDSAMMGQQAVAARLRVLTSQAGH
jgi:tetratricopeptide (TPR) repeat protein